MYTYITLIISFYIYLSMHIHTLPFFAFYVYYSLYTRLILKNIRIKLTIEGITYILGDSLLLNQFFNRLLVLKYDDL